MSKKVIGTTLALTAALAFAVAPVSSVAAEQSKVTHQCVNACKGKAACKGASNTCAGKNACKGKGFTSDTTKKACKKAGGKWTKVKK